MLRISQKPVRFVLQVFTGFFLLSNLSACGLFTPRPVRQMSYAEAAFQAAKGANAETGTPDVFQAARENLFKARAAYRLKNFRSARWLAVRSRLLSEEAEFKSLNADNNNETEAIP